MKPLVFLGSGVSLPTFGPEGSVASLTERLFDQPWIRDSSETWRSHPPTSTDSTPKCQEFLKRLRKHVENYYFDQRGSSVTYEDFFYLIEQITEELAWRGNAAVEAFRNQISTICADLVDARKSLYDNPLRKLATETLVFIQSVIAYELGKLETRNEPTGLDLLIEMAHQIGTEPLTICTLNHDRSPSRLSSPTTASPPEFSLALPPRMVGWIIASSMTHASLSASPPLVPALKWGRACVLRTWPHLRTPAPAGGAAGKKSRRRKEEGYEARHTRNKVPIFFPSKRVAARRVRPRKSIAHTPRAEATARPSPNKLNSS